jgi:predicted Zn-dependent protease
VSKKFNQQAALVKATVALLLLSSGIVRVSAQDVTPEAPKASASAPANEFTKTVSGFFGSLGKSINNTVTGERDTPQFDDLKPGVYTKSNEAIGEEKDINEARVTKGLLSVPSFTGYANRILDKLKATTPLQQVPGQVIVVSNEQLDAYSTADGNIFISAGYLRSLNSEDQLAALLAHELSHILLRHHDTNAIGKAQKQISTWTTTGMVLRNSLDKATAGGVTNQLSAAQNDTLLKMELLIKLNDVALGPAWGRRQEAEADRLGMDLLVKAGYSYSDGMLGWLALITKWDETQQAKRDQDKLVQQSAMQTLAASGKLDETMKKGLNMAFSEAITQLRTSHDSGDKRETAIDTYFVKAYNENVPKVAPTVKPLEQVKLRPDVKAVIDGYRDAYIARSLIQEQRFDEALKKLAPLVDKRSPIAANALPNQLMYEAYRGKGRHKESEEYLRKSFQSPDAVWESYDSAATYYRDRGNRDEILKVGQNAFGRFAGVPSAYPRLISLYRRHGLTKEAEEVRNECIFKQADKRDECISAAQGS